MEHKDCCQCEHCQKTKERSPEEYRSLMNHMKSCVAQNIREGNDEVIDELLDTLQKMMK